MKKIYVFLWVLFISLAGVSVNAQTIWTGDDITFTKEANADWTQVANQDVITPKVTITRQSSKAIYNYQWFQDTFAEDATSNDLEADFWDGSSDHVFTFEGGTQGIKWALLDNTGATTTWTYSYYGTLGNPVNFTGFGALCSIITQLEYDGGTTTINPNESIFAEGTVMTALVGKKLGVWLVEEDVYLTLTFTNWGAGGGGAVSYTRSTGTLCTPTTGTDVQTACDSYVWIDGNTYTESNNTATYTLTNAAGCDSVVTLDLTINESTTGTDVQTACDSYVWIDGNTYTESNNTATYTLTNAAGCDSVVTLDLTINESTTGTDVQTACDSYVWIDGNTYTESNNTATYTLTNAAGCDSVVTLDLTINESTIGTDVQTACDSYVWIDGNTYTESNNTATYTLTNAAGCDSVVTLDLTISESTTGTDVQTACGSYVWIDGNTYTESNNTATYTLTTAAGCDSVVTLDLTISESTTGTDVQTACDSYVWIDGNTYTESNNTATYTLTNAVGCDSVVTLNLTVNESTESTITESVSDSYTSPSGITLTESGTYIDTIYNAAGCDSIITINLTVVTSVIEVSGNTKLEYYPNPVNNELTIKFEKEFNGIINVYDLTGNLIERKEAYGSYETYLNFSKLKLGMYIVRLINNNGDLSELKIMKQ